MHKPTPLSTLAEFLLVGGVTPFLYPLAWALRRALGLDSSELAVGFLFFHAAHFVNDPHFSVTYLLFYRNVKRRVMGDVWGPVQRARYVFAGFVVPVALVTWAAVALASRSAASLGWLIQLMFLLVGWHYGKQGFGVLTVLSQRRGVVFDALERRILLFHVYAAWAYAWASPADPGTQMEERGVVYLSLAHGKQLERATLAVFVTSGLMVAFVLSRRLLARRALPPAGALLGFFSALWLWTVYSRIEPLVVYAIPALHSIQYLYFVALLERGNAAKAGAEPFKTRSASSRLALLGATSVALAWILFHGMPETLDAIFFAHSRRSLGSASFGDLGASPIVAAVFVAVNVHHYFMDYVIWRRENPEMATLRVVTETLPSAEVGVRSVHIAAE